jgi:hypothetical protein
MNVYHLKPLWDAWLNSAPGQGEATLSAFESALKDATKEGAPLVRFDQGEADELAALCEQEVQRLRFLQDSDQDEGFIPYFSDLRDGLAALEINTQQ